MCLGRPVSHMSGKSCKAGGMSALPPCVYSDETASTTA